VPVPTTPQAVAPVSRLLRDQVFTRVLDAIRAGDYKPGDTLADEDLESWLGVSRTPIRQALARLVSVGLVEMEPNRYTRVASIDAREFMNSTGALVALWKLAAESTIGNLSGSDTKKLKNLFDQAIQALKSAKSVGEVIEKTLEPLAFLAEKSGNAELKRIHDDVIIREEFQVRGISDRLSTKSYRKHLSAIRDAYLDNDAAAVASALDDLLTSSLERGQEYLDELDEPASTHVASRRRLLQDDVYERIARAIVDGTLLPGEVLRDDELTAWLQVSRTPLRQALDRLADNGLVETAPNRYTRVAVPSPERFRNQCEVLGSLSAYSAARGASDLPDEDLARLTEVVKTLQKKRTDSDAAAFADRLSLTSDIVTMFPRAFGDRRLATLLADMTLGINQFLVAHHSELNPARQAELYPAFLEAAKKRDGNRLASLSRDLWLGGVETTLSQLPAAATIKS
jgi:DNA-binding GntR family transcriptional regulator